jgi:hypothetical protein
MGETGEQKLLGLKRRFCLLGSLVLALSTVVSGQTWSWRAETVDKDPASFTSIAVSDEGDLHLSYVSNGADVKYAFRPAGESRWYTMALDGANGYTNIKLDQQGDPHICYAGRALKYARYNSPKWQIQEIAAGTGAKQFSCAVAPAPDGTPSVSWYQEKDADYSYVLHLKDAVLQSGKWLVRTVDFDLQTGKWHSMVADSRGSLHLTYDAFITGTLKYATWNGTDWLVKVVDARGLSRTSHVNNLGMGNSLVLDTAGKAHIAYETDVSLKYAYEKDVNWSIETVDTFAGKPGWVGYRTSVVLDGQGFPHIGYEDSGVVKHAYWDGKSWHVQLVAQGSYSAMTIDHKDTLYVCYRDASDDALKLATGRLVSTKQ